VAKYKFNPVFTKEWGKSSWVSVRNLVIPAGAEEDAYQRAARDSVVRQIAENLDLRAFGVITVVKRCDLNEELQVGDGGHRVRAILLRNKESPRANITISRLPAYVVEAHSPAEAASIFDKINTHRSALKFPEKHKARRIAGIALDVATHAYHQQLTEGGVEFDSGEALNSIWKKQLNAEAAQRLLPVFVQLAEESPTTWRLTGKTFKVLVRLERSLTPESSLLEPKNLKKLLATGLDQIELLIRGWASTKGGRTVSDEDIASNLAASLRIKRLHPATEEAA
jgi:hypothetical protein